MRSYFNTLIQSYEAWFWPKSTDYQLILSSVFIFTKSSSDARFFIKFTIPWSLIFRFSLSPHIWSSENRFWTFSYRRKIFLSYRRLHAKATSDRGRKSYKRWTCDLFSWEMWWWWSLCDLIRVLIRVALFDDWMTTMCLDSMLVDDCSFAMCLNTTLIVSSK